MRMGQKGQIVVIGGGVVGVCSAYYLAAADQQVILVEKDEICSGCSYGNAGLIVPSHSIPLAAPGVWAKALWALMRGPSPLYIRPRWDTALISWLWQFRAACTEQHARAGLGLLRDLHRASLGLFQELADVPGLEFGFRQAGSLMLFRTRHGFKEACEQVNWLQEAGIEATVLGSSDVRELEPTALPTLVGGIYFPEDAQILPAAFVQGLARVAESKGVRICSKRRVLGFETSGRRIAAVRTDRGELHADLVVLAGGAWSPLLSQPLGIHLPVQAGKGYSVTFHRLEPSPRLPLLLGEAKVAVTPMGDKLRISGILALDGLDRSIRQRQLESVLSAVPRYLTLPARLDERETWSGLRPCTPDGLPLIGRPAGLENLIIATGHGMLGMSLGPITGKLVAQLVTEEPPLVDLTPLSPDRFR